MEKTDIISQVNMLIREVFENENIVVLEETTAQDIEEWDSFSNTRLLVAIEKHFKIKFSLIDIIGYSTVGKMCDGIKSKIS